MRPDRYHQGDHSRKYKSRHERGYGAAWVKVRKLALQRDGYLCQHCLPDRVTPATDVDHKTPKAQGGKDDLDNLQSLCVECHKIKTAAENSKPVDQFDDQGQPIW